MIRCYDAQETVSNPIHILRACSCNHTYTDAVPGIEHVVNRWPSNQTPHTL